MAGNEQDQTAPSRRAVLNAGTLSAAAVAVASVGTTTTALSQSARRTFVLIHGAWHGGWCWRQVADLLEAKGHKVYTPTLTGLADRSHLLTRDVTLDTHITDVVNLFKWEDISNAVLVGHSYGGWPISGAVEKVLDQVSSIVYLDAFVPDNGDSGLSLSTQVFRKTIEDAIAKGELGRPPPKAEVFKILDPKKAEWVQSKMTAQPTAVSVQPIVLTGAREKVRRKTYIRTPSFANPRFDVYLAKAKADQTWKTYMLEPAVAGHDAMVDAPARVAEILMEVA